MNRRSFLRGLIAAPAIVAVRNIMPVRAIERFAAIPDVKLFGGWHGFEVGNLITLDFGAPKLFRITAINGHNAECCELPAWVIAAPDPHTHVSPEKSG